ncbi:MAG TPA: glucose-6-phosphate dehydrogenase assembly protein OpcA [Chloroflexia bacterium]|nr:glucose-6-phosphate dehydrogenase assembly protein OpcA [Chloroflexia bacterium]
MTNTADKNPFTFQDDDPSTIDSGAPIPVAVEYVDSQLNELWRDVAEAAQAKGGVQAVTTAQVLNLVIRARSYEAANGYVESIERITGRHPCRVIVATTDPSETDMPVQAWVSIHCQLPPSGGRQVCCEQVTVAAGGESVRRLPAAIIPLLLPDLPVFLWWPEGDPFDEYVFRNLADSLNRLIVDSATFENPEGTLAKMASGIKNQWPKVAVSDVNWGRLTPWREMVASFFDPPVMHPYLERLARIKIEYSEPAHGRGVNRTQALMMAGWLASRLDWESGENAYQLTHSESSHVPAAHIALKAGKRAVAIEIHASPWQAACPGELCSITVEIGGELPGDPIAATFSLTLTDQQEQCAISNVGIAGSETTSRIVQMINLEQADLLDEELEIYSRDTVYEDSLTMVGAFIRGTKHATRSTPISHKVPSGEPISASQAREQRTRPAQRPRN